MTNGTPRREAGQDSLAGKQDMQPVMLNGPGLSNPRAIRKPDRSMEDRVTQQLLQWGSGKLAAEVKKKQKRSILDGQMAHQQGQAFDQVETGGDKWALEGYRLMDAQTMSSTLLAAQQTKIDQGDFALDPDAFREQYINRLDGMLEGVDSRTADLVREQMTKQMPSLVSSHTAQHMRYLEKENFESLERGIEVISRDHTASEELVMFAKGGADSPSAGLSDGRRQAATVAGVIRAFDNDNAMAYSVLVKEGLLGDNLSTAEQNSIKAAQKRFEGRRRSEYNEELFNGEQTIYRQIEQAELSPSEAVEALSTLYADHDINMNSADAGAVYNEALGAERTQNATSAVNYEEARLRGDYAAMAAITEPILIQIESGGNPNAVSPVGAKGLMQVMDATNADPGYGVRPAQNDTPAERVRVGKDYWKAMVGGSSAHPELKWAAGDLEAAAVGYNAGPGVAHRWMAAGRDDSVLPAETRAYKAKMVGGLQGWKAPTAAARLSIAQDHLAKTRERLAVETYEQIAPKLADADDAYKAGAIGRQEWQARRGDLYDTYNQARTTADVNHEIGVNRSVDAALAAAAKTASNEDYKVRLEAAQAGVMPAKLEWEKVVDDPASTPQEIVEANSSYAAARSEVYDTHGIKAVDRGTGAETEAMYRRTSEAFDAHRKWGEEQAEINTAVAMSYLDKLPKELQQRAADAAEKEIVQTYTREVAEGRMTEQQANSEITADINTFYAQSGMVPPKVALRMSAAMMGPMIDKDGNPNPMAVDALTQYAHVKSMNPGAAEHMLDPEAMVRAEAALSRADHPNMFGEAIRNIGLELSNNPLIQDTREYMARPEVQSSINREVTNFLEERDIGALQAIWQGDANMDQIKDRDYIAQERMNNEETRTLLKTELAAEVERLQTISPGLKPRDLVAKAAERMAARTEIIGGDTVMMKPGSSFREAFFGGRASEFSNDGAVNSAVMEWLRSPAAQEQYGFISGTTGAEQLPGWVQGAIGLAARALPGDVDFDPALSRYEAWDANYRGVRPFRAMISPGNDVVVRILKPDGNYSDNIVVPAQEAGEMYMERRRRELTK